MSWKTFNSRVASRRRCDHQRQVKPAGHPQRGLRFRGGSCIGRRNRRGGAGRPVWRSSCRVATCKCTYASVHAAKLAGVRG